VTATWASTLSGSTVVRSATHPAGGSWAAPATLAPCASTCVPQLAAARDGSITVVGFAFAGGASPNVAVRLGQGSWTTSSIGASVRPIAYVAATNGAGASAVWIFGIQVKYHNSLKLSDFR
jgi:hypothetical protein